MALAPPAPMMPPTGAAPPEMPMDDAGGSGEVLVTICSDGAGGYTVYAGDESEEGEADMSGDDVAATDAGDESAPEGQPADSVGAALKLAMDMLNQAKGAEGAAPDAEQQFAAGFGAPAGGAAMQQKY